MKTQCSVCGEQLHPIKLHRVRHRLICRPCFRTEADQLRTLETGGLGPGNPGVGLYGGESVGDRMARLNLRADRIHMGFIYAGLVLKALFYVGMFWWAGASESGAAALQGVVYADILTWIVFVLLEAPFQMHRILTGSGFELLLVLVFLFRGTLLDISTDAVSAGIGVLWFILFLALRAGIYGAEATLRNTGVTDGSIASQ